MWRISIHRALFWKDINYLSLLFYFRRIKLESFLLKLKRIFSSNTVTWGGNLIRLKKVIGKSLLYKKDSVTGSFYMVLQ
jgi:hypothetical protein